MRRLTCDFFFFSPNYNVQADPRVDIHIYTKFIEKQSPVDKIPNLSGKTLRIP